MFGNLRHFYQTETKTIQISVYTLYTIFPFEYT